MVKILLLSVAMLTRDCNDARDNYEGGYVAGCSVSMGEGGGDRSDANDRDDGTGSRLFGEWH